MKLLHKFRSSILEGALDLIFPIFCQGCLKEGEYLCLFCQAKIQPPLERCFVCGKNSFLGKVHSSCESRNFVLNGLLVAADYRQESIRNLIWHLKYSSVESISETLSIILTDYFISRDLQTYFASSVIVPVPLHKNKQKIRGFNQAEAIAEKFAQRLGLEYLPSLEKLKNVESQVELERQERLLNVKGVFAAKPIPSLGERKVILIDDVATTGATLNECAKVLKKQGVKEIWGLVVARN